MRTASRLIVATLLVALLAACGGTQTDTAASVDGVAIATVPFENSVRMAVGDDADASDEDTIAATRAEILGYFILRELYGHAVDEAGIEISDEQYAADRAREIEGLGGEDGYEEYLNSIGYAVELFEVLVALDTMNTALQQHFFEAEEARTIRHILVETEEEAQEVLDELEGGADFAELAAERSTDPGSAQSGGEYPPAPRGQWVPEFDEAVWSADIGDLLGPIETQFGFHVIEVLDEVTLTADELDPAQIAQATGAQVDELLRTVLARVDVSVASSVGEWDSETRRVIPAGTEPRVGSGSSEPTPDDTEPLDEPLPLDE